MLDLLLARPRVRVALAPGRAERGAVVSLSCRRIEQVMSQLSRRVSRRPQSTMPSLRVRPAYLLCCRPPLPSSASSSPSALGHFTTAPSPSRPRLTGCLRSLSSSSSSSSSAASVPPPPPFLFLVGGPCAGKGTQSRLLVEEFGREVQSTSDGTVVDPAILARLSQKHPPARSRGQRRGVALVHVSIGALLRREMQQSTMTTGHNHQR